MITQLETDKALISYYMPYAMKTITDRALPDVRDGLKPIHRRILWKMYQVGLTYDKPRMKCGTIVGDILKIHNHGDSSCYEALALLTEQNESLLHAFIDGEGAFGKVYSKDSPSAMRYTFARLNKFSEEMFKDIDKNTVKFIGEDKDHLQPLALTNTFPNILLKPNSGMAVGESCNWASFNLNEIVNTTIEYIKNKDINLIDYLTAPDFSTGGYLIYSKEDLETIYNTGKGSFKLRSKYRYNKEHNCIEVYEIPYNTTSNNIIAEIKTLIKDNKIKEILDVREETGYNKEIKKEQLMITIDIRRNTDVNIIMQKLFKLTSLEKSFSCNFNCLVNYRPKVLGIKEILDNWLSFRIECITNSLNYDINKKSEQLHLLKGLEKVLLDIDKAIQIIRFSKSDDLIISNLMKEFNIDEVQANEIANMKLRNINQDYILKKIKSINDLEKLIDDLKNTVGNSNKINEIIIAELKEVSKKYSCPRKTEILYEEDIEEVSENQLIEEYNTMCYLSKEGYYKKVPLTSLRGGSTNKLKDGDELLNSVESSNKSTVLLFSNKGVCYKLYQHEIEDHKLQSMGLYLPTQLQLDKDEKIISMVSTRKYTGSLCIAFTNGKIARIDMQSFKTKNMRSKLENSLSIESPLVNMFILEQDTELLCVSSICKILIINTKDILAKASKNTSGNQILKSKNNSTMTMCVPLNTIDTTKIENLDYYRGNTNAVGTFIKKTDTIEIIN